MAYGKDSEVGDVDAMRAIFDAAIAAYRDLPSSLRRLSVRRRDDVPTVEAVDVTVKLTVPSMMLAEVLGLIGE